MIPSERIIVLPASAVPVIVGFGLLVSWSPEIVGVSVVVSILISKFVVAAGFPTESIADTVSMCVPSANSWFRAQGES